MVDFLTAVGIGTALGFLAGMGIGGGSLLLLWLTQVVLMEQDQARILNLLFYLPAAVTATCFRLKGNRIEPSIVIPGLAAGCLSAAVFSFVGRMLPLELAKKLLGGLLVIVGLREIFYRPRKAK